MNARLYRSRTDAMIAGVCGGLGRYLRVDSTFVRLFFVLLALAGTGIGVLVYFLLWIIVPLEGQAEDATLGETVHSSSQEIADRTRALGEDLRGMVDQSNPRAGFILGAGLILLGVIYLLQNLGLPWLRWLRFDLLWPLLLIVAGAAILVRFLRGE